MPINPLRLLDANYDPLSALLADQEPPDPLRKLKRLGLVPDDSQQAADAGPAFPPFQTQQETDSVLGTLMAPVMGGLQAVGSVLDKPGRAIRGLLAGKPREALNILPIPTDTLGITDPTQSTSGRELLEGAGILDKNTPGFDAGDVAGFAADVALDPLTYLGGLGSLTKLGKAANASGKLARAGGAVGKTGALTDAASLAAEASARGLLAPTLESGILAGQKSLASFQVPFAPSTLVNFGTGAKAAQFAGKHVDPLIDFAKYGNPVGRTVNRLFNSKAGDMATGLGQKLHEEEFVPRFEDEMLKRTMPLQGELTDLVNPAGAAAPRNWQLDDLHSKAMRAGAEFASNEGKSAELIAQMAQGNPDLAATLGEAAGMGQELHRQLKGMIPELNEWGVKGAELADDVVDYMARSHRPEEYPGVLRQLSSIFKQRIDLYNRKPFLKGFEGGTNQINDLLRDPAVYGPKAEAEKYVASLLSGEEATTKARQFVGWANSLGPEYRNGADFFNVDPLTDTISRMQMHVKQLTNAQFIHELGRRTATQFPSADEAAAAGYKPLLESLTGAGLSHNPPPTIIPGAAPVIEGVQKKAAELAGLDPTQIEAVRNMVEGEWKTTHRVKGLGNLYVPQEIAADMARVGKAWKTPEALKTVVETYDAMLNWWKNLSTQIWPGFHSRNAISGLYYNAVAGATTPGAGGMLRDVQDAIKLRLSNGQIDPERLAQLGLGSTNDLLTEMRATGVLKPGNSQAMDAVGAAGNAAQQVGAVGSAPVRQTFRDNLRQSLNPVKEAAQSVAQAARQPIGNLGNIAMGAGDLLSEVSNLGRKTGNATEDVLRIAHYIGARANGQSVQQAAASVKKWLFDYAELSQFEKAAMKRIMPFYSFARKNLPLVLTELMQRPGGAIGQTIRLANAPRQDGGFIPQHVSEGLAVKIPGYESRYLTGLGLPIESAFDPFAIGATPSATVQRNIEGLISQSTPIAKYLYTAASGREPFSGRELKDLYQYPTSSMGINALANSVIGTPISRVRTLLDERKTPEAKALNLLTGMRITDVTGGEERAKELAARKITERILSENPSVKGFTRYYVPPEQRGNLTPEMVQAMRLEETLLRHAKEAKKKKALAGGGRV